MVTYQAKQLPVYATLDGKNLISDLIPLDGSTDSGTTDVGSTGTVTIDAQKLSAAPMEGNKDAKVQVVEFSDFQCPFCGKFYSDAYSQLKKDYIDTGKIAFYFMDFPLSFHPNAPKAAEAAHCAADQKGNVGFFQMHNKLFDNNALLNSASTDEALKSYKQWARDLNLDVGCLALGSAPRLVDHHLGVR
jgi:protein-disulfide isomerase